MQLELAMTQTPSAAERIEIELLIDARRDPHP